MDTGITRRSYLSLSAVALSTSGAVSGCLGGDSGGGFGEHPSTAGVEENPSVGDGQKHVVAFEDPSCPNCARFSRETFPELRQDAQAGEITFHARPVSFVADWSDFACRCLLSTHDDDPEAFWALFEGYYGNQRRANTENIGEVTREVLSETDVDADAVLTDAEQGRFGGVIENNLATARDAGISQTPSFYLFDADGFVTDASGPRNYETFATALNL